MSARIPTALTIAGSDSGGGAGIQADLKTFSALGVFGTSAITAITAQNTVGVTAVQALESDLIAAQIDAVLDDIGADAVKTGMLVNSAIVELVAQRARDRGLTKLVVDPVMVAKSGDKLLADEAIDAVRGALLPAALVVTPNHGEAEVLVGRRLASDDEVRAGARDIAAMGAKWVVMKGGHRPGAQVVDVLYGRGEFWELGVERIETTSTHGTGCTFAAAIAARLAHGDDVPDAVRAAHDFVHEAIARAPKIGHGHGPLHHFWRWY